MQILSCNATLHDQRNTSWESGYARQGKYSTILHRGLIVFPSLATTSMKGKDIKDIGLKFVCSSSGYASESTMYIYQTTKISSGGTATSWIGAGLGTIVSTFYNNTKTYNSLKSSHAALFKNMKAYLENGGRAIALYVNEDLASGKDFSKNYMSITSLVMTVTYESDNVWRHNGTEWIGYTPYCFKDKQFVKCAAYRHDGTGWKK